MPRFLIRRVLTGVLVLWTVTTCVFLLFFATSRDPAAPFAGKSATPATLALLRHRMGLDEPLIKGSLQITVSLVAGGAALWLVTGVVTGTMCATRARSVLDRGVTVAVLAGISVPVFVTALTLLYVFAFRLRVLPRAGYVPVQDDPVGRLRHLMLPWITMALLQSAANTRLTRGSLLDVLGEDYVRTAWAKGLRRRRVVYRHALRAAVTPVLTQFGIDLGGALSGALVTETVYGMPGLGHLSVDAMTAGDLPVIMAIVLLAACFIVAANLAVDVVYAVLDPRVRLS
jgi:peptide/nickel transport system permease protein